MEGLLPRVEKPDRLRGEEDYFGALELAAGNALFITDKG